MVHQFELVRCEPAGDLAFERRTGRDERFVHHHPVLARGLRRVQRLVRLPQQLIGLDLGVPDPCGTAHRYRQLRVVGLPQGDAAYGVEELSSDRRGRRDVRVRQNDRKLLTAEPGQQIALALERRGKRARDRAQRGIAYEMPEDVVELLEVVDVPSRSRAAASPWHSDATLPAAPGRRPDDWARR